MQNIFSMFSYPLSVIFCFSSFFLFVWFLKDFVLFTPYYSHSQSFLNVGRMFLLIESLNLQAIRYVEFIFILHYPHILFICLSLFACYFITQSLARSFLFSLSLSLSLKYTFFYLFISSPIQIFSHFHICTLHSKCTRETTKHEKKTQKLGWFKLCCV